jgi:hypothetical protein
LPKASKNLLSMSSSRSPHPSAINITMTGC